MYEISKRDMDRGRNLLRGAIGAPIVLTAIPALATLLIMFLAPVAPPTAVVVLFLGFVATMIGFLAGITLTAIFAHRRSNWTKEMRERIAANGIGASEIEWFRRELKTSEKRALKSIEARDELLGDAYRETLASRLTATRIIQSAKRELQAAKRRQNSIKQLKSARSEDFEAEIGRDIQKITNIHEQAKEMLAEAETRLQMIEAAGARGGSLSDHEIALKKLSARTKELPLALESAKMTEALKRELDKELADDH